MAEVDDQLTYFVTQSAINPDQEDTFLKSLTTLNPLPASVRVVLITIISVFIVVSNIVNLFVLRITTEIPPISRMCLLNLSIADLLVGVLSCMPCIYPAAMGDWPYGAVWCQIAGITHGMSVTMSIWSLGFVSVDRYFAIVHPLRYTQLMKPARCRNILAALWLLAFATFFMPLPTKSDFIYYRFSRSELMCGLYWEYPWFCVVTAVYIPVLSGSLLLFTTFRIGREVISLQRKRHTSVAPQPQQYAAVAATSSEREQPRTTRTPEVGTAPNTANNSTAATTSSVPSRRVTSKELRPVKVLAVTAGIYFLVWGPYVAEVVVVSFFRQLDLPALLRFATIWLANCNSFMNVIVYSVMYSGFRRNAWWLLRCAVARVRRQPRPLRHSDGGTLDRTASIIRMNDSRC